jgi:hypothetical protein
VWVGLAALQRCIYFAEAFFEVVAAGNTLIRAPAPGHPCKQMPPGALYIYFISLEVSGKQ